MRHFKWYTLISTGACKYYIFFYYIGTDEIAGFLLLLKNHILTARSEDTIFIFHV